MNTRPPTAKPESLLATVRSFPRPVWVLFGGVFLNKFGTFVLPFLAIYLTRRGFTQADAGIALGCYGLGRIAAAFLGGQLADTLGRRNTIVLSMVLTAVTMMALAHADSLVAIALLTALASLTGEMYVPACTALLTDLTSPAQRVTVFSTYRMSFNAGWAFGPAVAAFLAKHSFTWLFIGDAVTSLLFAVIAWKWLPRGGNGTREASWGEAVATLVVDQAFVRVAGATLFIGICIHQMVSSYGVHVGALGFSDTTYGLLLSLNGVLVLCCELPLTRVTSRLPAQAMMALGYVLIGCGLMTNLFARSLPELVLGMTLFTFGEMTFAPVASAHVSKLARANMRGRYMGGWAVFNSLSMFIAPNLGMRLHNVNPNTLWTFCGICSVIAAWIILSTPRVAKSVGSPDGERAG